MAATDLPDVVLRREREIDTVDSEDDVRQDRAGRARDRRRRRAEDSVVLRHHGRTHVGNHPTLLQSFQRCGPFHEPHRRRADGALDALDVLLGHEPSPLRRKERRLRRSLRTHADLFAQRLGRRAVAPSVEDRLRDRRQMIRAEVRDRPRLQSVVLCGSANAIVDLLDVVRGAADERGSRVGDHLTAAVAHVVDTGQLQAVDFDLPVAAHRDIGPDVLSGVVRWIGASEDELAAVAFALARWQLLDVEREDGLVDELLLDHVLERRRDAGDGDFRKSQSLKYCTRRVTVHRIGGTRTSTPSNFPTAKVSPGS